MKKNTNGFTLIEVVIVVAIMGIIAAVAFPSYMSFMEKTRRAEAITVLTEVAGELQRFQTENNTYTDDLTELGYSAATTTSETGLYLVTVSGSTANSYLLTAAPVAGKAQQGDTKCASLTLNSLGVKGTTGTAADAEECW